MAVIRGVVVVVVTEQLVKLVVAGYFTRVMEVCNGTHK